MSIIRRLPLSIFNSHSRTHTFGHQASFIIKRNSIPITYNNRNQHNLQQSFFSTTRAHEVSETPESLTIKDKLTVTTANLMMKGLVQKVNLFDFKFRHFFFFFETHTR
jgi:hypothetical protein